MRKLVEFGPLLPDLPPAGQLVGAENVFATPNGYGPVGAVQTFAPPLTGWSGGGAFVGSDGVSSLLSGTSTNLYRFSSGAWTSVLATSAARWRFAQFGDNVIAVNGGAPVTYDLTTGTAAVLGGSPPASDMVVTIRDFVVVAGNPAAILTVTWSGNNDSTEWTPGTDESDSQQMLDGGEVMGLAGGEYGVVLQRNAIKRMTYEGPPIGFRFDEISSNVGCMAKGSVVQAGRLVFFLSERGFMLCDGNEARPIGSEKIDRTFFDRYAREDITTGIYAAVDPRRYTVMWAMPGVPGMIWAYNWILDRWTTISADLTGVFSGFTANVSIEGVDILYPGGIDTVPGSLDDPQFSGGNPLLLVVDAVGAIGTLSGDNMAARFSVADMELAQGRSRVRMIRPVTDATAVSCTMDTRARAGDLSEVRTSGSMRASGDVPIRANGRTFKLGLEIPAGQIWSYVQGSVVEFEAAGER